MIFKVMTSNYSWYYYSGIQDANVQPEIYFSKTGEEPEENEPQEDCSPLHFSYSPINKNQPSAAIPIDETHIQFNRFGPVEDGPNKGMRVGACSFIQLHREKGGSIWVAYDTKAFLLSDEGKTIDRV